MMGASQVDAKMDRTLKSNPSLPPISYSEVASQVDENGSHIEVQSELASDIYPEVHRLLPCWSERSRLESVHSTPLTYYSASNINVITSTFKDKKGISTKALGFCCEQMLTVCFSKEACSHGGCTP
jgi:hypothetical protein